jgi:hypothetical protein
VTDDPIKSERTFSYEICGGTGSVVNGETCGPPQGLSVFDLTVPDLCGSGSPNYTVSFNPGVFSSCDTDAPPSPQQTCDPYIETGDSRIHCKIKEGVTFPATPGQCATVSVIVQGEANIQAAGVHAGMGGTECEGLPGLTCFEDSCIEMPPDDCFTRTRGFWGTHPAITEQFLDVAVCGTTLDTVDINTAGSAIEDLCADTNVRKGKFKGADPAYLSLLAQLAAAKLNFNAAADNNGSCDDTLGQELEAAGCQYSTLVDLEAALCNKSGAVISASNCIEGLDAFNNSQDAESFASTPPPPFDRPGPASPSSCNEALKNGFVNSHPGVI